MSAPPLPEIFGNYVLGEFVEVVAPSAISWLPQTPGWVVVAAILLVWGSYRASLAIRHWYRNRYRQEAQTLLQRLPSQDINGLVANVNRLLKLTALSAFPREQVASLCGACWPQFLNSRCAEPVFDDEQCTLLASATYAQASLNSEQARQLLQASATWVETHRNRYDD